MAIEERFENIGLSGQAVGSLSFTERGLEWRGPASAKMVQVRGLLAGLLAGVRAWGWCVLGWCVGVGEAGVGAGAPAGRFAC